MQESAQDTGDAILLEMAAGYLPSEFGVQFRRVSMLRPTNLTFPGFHA